VAALPVEVDARNVIPLPGFQPCEAAVPSPAGPRPCTEPAAPGEIWAGDDGIYLACEGHHQVIASGYVDPDELTWIRYGTAPARSSHRGGAA